MIKYIFLSIGLLAAQLGFSQKYDIKVKLNGLSCDDVLLLANHFGEKQYLRDTAECENGIFHFRGDKRLESGVYLVVLPEKNYFEILVSANEDQTKYYFEADTSLKQEKMITKGSEENTQFFAFNRFAGEKGTIAIKLQAESKDEKTSEKRKEAIREELMGISKEVSEKRAAITANNPNLFISKLYRAMTDLEIPNAPEDLEKNEAQKFQYLWIREHYWDNVDMSEDGIVRSPVFHNKLKSYFDEYVPPIPDTAIMLTDKLISEIEQAGSKEQFKYTIHFLLGYFEKSKYMCFDKAVYHLAKNYYCAGKAFWSDSSFTAKMCEESAKMEPTLCDQIAPELSMPDTSFSKRITMSQITTPVTVLIFWDINCGHCKKEMPIVSAYYDTINKQHVEIYAVYTQGDWEGWKQRIKEEKYKFINVGNAFGEDEFRDNYNIRSTPQIYVLDKDKKIRFKKIGAENIAETVRFLLEDQGIIPKKEKEEIK